MLQPFQGVVVCEDYMLKAHAVHCARALKSSKEAPILPPFPGTGSGIPLTYQDLTGKDFKGQKLYKADLRGTNFSKADMKGASLFGAFCKDAKFNGADLSNADLESVDFDGADLSEAVLEGAQVGGELA